MRRFPRTHGFAWIDAGFNYYRIRHRVPPPAPWRSWWADGRLVGRFHAGACHNEERGTSFARCVVGTYLYGDRPAWTRFVTQARCAEIRCRDAAARLT